MKVFDTGRPHARFYIDRSGALAQAAVIFMALSAVFRLVGCWGLWQDSFFTATQIVLPLACNALFIICILLCAKRALALTCVPVILGVVFFIIKAFSFESWLHTILCILLYLLVAVLYTGTVTGVIRTKWLLPPLFGLPFLYHVLVEDIPAMRDTANPVTLAAGMQEISVLCILLALLCAGLAMKKTKPLEETELPKIKDPVVRAPAKAASVVSVSTDAPAPDAGQTPADSGVENTQSDTGESV